MVKIVATSSATPSLQATLSLARLQQARQEADLAESRAQELRARADDAEQDAKTGRDRVRQLSATNTAPQDTTYAQQLRAAATAEVVPPVQNFLERLYMAASAKSAAAGNASQTQGKQPVLNTQGQSTGRILNVQA